MKHSLSIIVIAKNEEARIVDCLDHLAFADEVILVDNGSSDKTIDLARSHGAIVLTAAEKDFASVRELGLREAKGIWVLYVDADEEVGESLQKEIQRNIRIYKSGGPTGYFVKRDTYFLGHHWPYQDMVQRLFLNSALKGWHGKLHETPIFAGDTAVLVHPLIHRTHRTLEEMVEKTNDWSEIEARLRFEAHHPRVVWWRLLRVMFTGFFRSYVDQRGYRAGAVGWIESIYQGFSMFITYAKLWEMQETKK